MLKFRSNSSLQNRLVRWGMPPLYKLFQESCLSDVGLKSPSQSQHNEGVGGCNEGKPKASI